MKLLAFIFGLVLLCYYTPDLAQLAVGAFFTLIHLGGILIAVGAIAVAFLLGAKEVSVPTYESEDEGN